MALPAAGFLSNNARTEGEIKTALEDQRDFIEALPGGKAEGAYVIATGVVTPDQTSVFTVDTQAAAASDDLDRIATTNFTAGAVIYVHQLVAARDVTMRHLQGGDGQLNLLGAVNYNLAETDVYSLFIMVAGSPNQWREIDRWFGNQHAQFRTFRGFGTASTVNTGTAAGNVPLVSQIVGKQSIWVPVAAMQVPTTGGASAPGVSDLGGGSFINSALFSDTVEQALIFDWVPPKAYDGGTVTFEAYWTTVNASTNGVVWGLSGIAIGDNQGFGAYGTAGKVTDNGLGVLTSAVSAESAAVTIGGTPVNRDRCAMRIARFVGDAGDTLAAGVNLIGIRIFFTTNALNDN